MRSKWDRKAERDKIARLTKAFKEASPQERVMKPCSENDNGEKDNSTQPPTEGGNNEI